MPMRSSITYLGLLFVPRCQSLLLKLRSTAVVNLSANHSRFLHLCLFRSGFLHLAAMAAPRRGLVLALGTVLIVVMVAATDESALPLLAVRAPSGAETAAEHSPVVLTFEARNDRFGSFLQVAVAAMTVAAHENWQFCAPKPYVQNVYWFARTGFPVCSDEITAGPKLPMPWNPEDVHGEGVYEAPEERPSTPDREGLGLWEYVQRLEQANARSGWGAQSSLALKQQFMRANQHVEMFPGFKPSAEKELAPPRKTGSRSTLTIAVHVRRGDIAPGNMRWIPDSTFLALLRETKRTMKCRGADGAATEAPAAGTAGAGAEAGPGPGRRCAVHLFSEAENPAGDWAPYTADGLVDEMHLVGAAPDLESALRDWLHFIDADVLIVGSTFSAVPALARSPSLLTMYWEGHHGYFGGSRFTPHWWLPWKVNADGSVVVPWGLCSGRRCTSEEDIDRIVHEDLAEAEDFFSQSLGAAASALTQVLAAQAAAPTSALRGGNAPGSRRPADRLLCVAVAQPETEWEMDLLFWQREHSLGIFGCDQWVVLSNVDEIPVPDMYRHRTPPIPTMRALKVVDHSLHVKRGGEWHTALNAPLFAEIWTTFLDAHDPSNDTFDWLVKVDLDAVFLPTRLRASSCRCAGPLMTHSRTYTRFRTFTPMRSLPCTLAPTNNPCRRALRERAPPIGCGGIRRERSSHSESSTLLAAARSD